MSTSKITVISEVTDEEWSPLHPMRRQMHGVASDEFIKKYGTYLVCGYADDPDRLPPPPGDSDVPCDCAKCGAKLLRRSSGPNYLDAICFPCYRKE